MPNSEIPTTHEQELRAFSDALARVEDQNMRLRALLRRWLDVDLNGDLKDIAEDTEKEIGRRGRTTGTSEAAVAQNLPVESIR